VTSAFAELAREVFGPDAQVDETFDVVTVAVPASDWVTAMQTARDAVGCRFFDWLSAVDDGDDGFRVVSHVWSLDRGAGLIMTTRVPRADATLPTVTPVYRGANWHERETHEMFGIDFVGHPFLVPLLLPDAFEGHPLRKDFVLAARAAKVWPGAKEPGESGHAAPSRRKTLPPGVPDPSWGPRSPHGETAEGGASVGDPS
jgi:NADH-quinone oxidoreductase subunit C